MTLRPRSILAACVASLVVLAGTHAARADDDPEARQAAERDFKAGFAQLNAGDYEQARISFLRSLGTWPTAHALQDLAYTELLTGRCVDALGHYRELLRSGQIDPTFAREKAPQLREQCARQVGHLRIIAPAGAAVTIDGKSVREPGDGVEVAPGMHDVVLKRPDASEARKVRAPAGETVDVRFETASTVDQIKPPDAPLPASNPPVLAPPSAKNEAHAPTAAGIASATTTGGEGSRAHFLTPRRVWGLAIAGVGAATLAASGAFALGAKAKADDVTGDLAQVGSGRSNCFGPSSTGACSRLHSDADSQNEFRTLSQVFLGVGIAAAAAGVVTFVWPDPARSHDTLGTQAPAATRIQVVPGVSRQGAFVTVGGNF